MAVKRIFRYLFGQTCLLCGKSVEVSDENLFCPECAEAMADPRLKFASQYFTDTVSLYRFEDPVKQGLYRFKYGGEKALGKWFGEQLAERYQKLESKADVITCVPRAKDGRPRRYNQSEVIAKAMSQSLGIPFDARILSKRSGFLSQVECPTRLAREENAKNAYRTGSSKTNLSGKRVVLVDDLYTSGATARACSDLIKQQGSEEVAVYTALRVAPLQKFKLYLNYERIVESNQSD